MTGPLMTGEEVAVMFGVSAHTVYRWGQRGTLATVPLPGGRGFRYFRAEAESHLRGEPLTPEQVAELRDELSGAS